MITFAIVLAILLTLAIITVITLLAGGIGLVAAFGDIIVFALIIWLLVKLFRRRRGS